MTAEKRTIAAKGSREEKLRAVTTVLRGIPDRAAQREVLDALFATGRPQLHHMSSKPTAHVEARTAYLEEVRAWVLAEHGRVLAHGQIPEGDERAFVAATGRRFEPPAAPAPKPKRSAPQLQPCGTDAAYQRHMAHGEPVDEACRRAANLARAESKRRVEARAKTEAA